MNPRVILHLVQHKEKRRLLLFSICSPEQFSIKRVVVDLKMTNQKSLKKNYPASCPTTSRV